MRIDVPHKLPRRVTEPSAAPAQRSYRWTFEYPPPAELEVRKGQVKWIENRAAILTNPTFTILFKPFKLPQGPVEFLAKSELAPLELAEIRQAQVLVVVGKSETSITLNLKAPLVINLPRRQGRQVVANNDYPVQYELSSPRKWLKSA